MPLFTHARNAILLLSRIPSALRRFPLLLVGAHAIPLILLLPRLGASLSIYLRYSTRFSTRLLTIQPGEFFPSLN